MLPLAGSFPLPSPLASLLHDLDLPEDGLPRPVGLLVVKRKCKVTQCERLQAKPEAYVMPLLPGCRGLSVVADLGCRLGT
jgi:hypothetical protein